MPAIQPFARASTTFNRAAGRGESLYVTLRLQSGEELPFMIDTGSSVTILDKSLESKLGRRLETRQIQYGWYGKTSVGIYAAPRVYLGGVPLRTGDRVMTDDLSHIYGRMKGILGMDCLHYYCLQLDFASGKMRFLDPDHLDSEDLGKAYPLRISRALATRGNLAGVNGADSLVDTAEYWDGAIKSDIFQRMTQDPNTVATQCWKDSQGTQRFAARFKKVVFDNETYPDLVLRENPDGVNFIGLRFLARHLVTLDFPKHTMYLKRTSIGPLPVLPGTTAPLTSVTR